MTAYDVLSYTFTQDFDCTAEDNRPRGIFFSSDGMKMFMCGIQNFKVYEYNLSGEFDISTAVFSGTSLLVSVPIELFFKPDGTKMYVLDSGETLHEYNLSTPWSLATAVLFQSKFINVDNAMAGLFINSTGTIMYTCGFGSNQYGTADQLYKYTFGTPWDVSTIINPNPFGGSGHFHTTENIPAGIWQHPDQNKLFYVGQEENTQNQNRNVYSRTQSPANAMGGGIGARIDLEINAHAGLPSPFDNGPYSLFFSNFGQSLYYVRRSGQTQGVITQWSTAVDGLEKEFTINAVLTKDFQNSFVGAKVVVRKEVTPFIGARLVLFCDNIDTDLGWITTNGGGQILVDDVSFPDRIHFESMLGGGGVTERWTSKNTQLSLSGDIKLEFKFDFIAMGATDPFNAPSGFSIFLQQQNIHTANPTGSRIGCILTETENLRHHLYGEVFDGSTLVTSIQGGAHNQRTTHVYPPNQHGAVGIVEPSVLGPYWITVELKDNKFRMSLFLDESKTIHARGSPREVDATGINPANLQYLVIANDKGQSSIESITTADIDSIYITKNEPLPPLSQNTQTATLVEDWENSSEFDQNPEDWISATDLPILLNTPFNVSSATLNQAFDGGVILNSPQSMFIRKDTGQTLYIMSAGSHTIVSYFLPTPFSLTGAIFDNSVLLNVGGQGAEFPAGMHWKDNGFRLYTISPNLSINGTFPNIKEWSPPTTAWELNLGGSPILVKEENTRDELNEGRTGGIMLNPLGNRMYITSHAITAGDITNGWTNSIYQYNLDAQPFNIGNRGVPVASFVVGNGMAQPKDMWMSDDGLILAINGTNQINMYNLSTPFEISTAVFFKSRVHLPDFQNGYGVSFRPDGLKYFVSDIFNPDLDDVREYDVPTIFPPLTDITEVSTEQPNGGIKSFKLHTKFQGDGVGTSMRASVIGKRLATLPNPDGGELLIPLKFTAKARSEIMSAPLANRARGGTYITYELIEGAPFTQVNITRGFGFTMFKDNATTGGPMVAFNDVEGLFANMQNKFPETDSPDGSYFTLTSNIKDIFQADGVFDGNGLDFESHVKSISIGFWTDLNAPAGQTSDVEALMYGDEINLLPENLQEKEFFVNAILGESMTKEKEVFVNKFIKSIGGVSGSYIPTEFTVGAKVGVFNTVVNFSATHVSGITQMFVDDNVVEKEFFLNARLVIRTAVNCFCPNALLQATFKKEPFVNARLLKGGEVPLILSAFLVDGNAKFPFLNALIKSIGGVSGSYVPTTFIVDGNLSNAITETFFINALIKAVGGQSNQPSIFTINAIIEDPTESETFTVNALVGLAEKDETFTISAVVGLSEPLSILEVESVIGHKAGLQS